MDLLDKMFIYSTVIKSTSKLNSTVLTHFAIVNTLNAIKILNDRHGNNVQLFGLCYFLRSNHHSISFKLLESRLRMFEDAGLIRWPNSRINITVAGRLALSDLNKALKAAHFKYKRPDIKGVKKAKTIDLATV